MNAEPRRVNTFLHGFSIESDTNVFAKRILQTVDVEDGRIFSKVLGLEIVDTGKTLRLFNPQTKEFLPTTFELAEKANERDILADENERLKAELEKLRKQLQNSES